MKHYLFTYGTLRLNHNHPMADYLANNATLIGLGCIHYAQLFKIDWYPALIKTTNPNDIVVGDVFELKAANVLEKLDEYEGIGTFPFEYRREKVAVKLDNTTLESCVYFYNIALPETAEIIESGDFLNP